MSIQRTHKGERIKPGNMAPSFTPWVGTETVWLTEEDGRTWVAMPFAPGATAHEFASVGACYTGASGMERDVWRLPLADWDELVAQVERLRQQDETEREQ